jgi:hypothetical protein
MHHVRKSALLVLVGLCVVVVIWLSWSIYEKQWLKVATLDEFGILAVEAEKYVATHPGTTALNAKAGMMAAYQNRTGKTVPLDGWGHTIGIDMVAERDSFMLKFRSAGPDGAMGTADDIVQQVQLRMTPAGTLWPAN